MPHPGGRPKGSVSRRSLTVGQLCRKLKYDPVTELIELKNSTYVVMDKDGQPVTVGVSPELRAKVAADLLPYIHPKLSAVQVTGEGGGPIKITHYPPEPKTIAEWEAERLAAMPARELIEDKNS